MHAPTLKPNPNPNPSRGCVAPTWPSRRRGPLKSRCVLLLAGRWVYKNSKLSGSDNFERWYRGASRMVKSSVRENIQQPIEHLVREATTQLKRPEAVVKEADVRVDRDSLHRMLQEFEGDHGDKARQGDGDWGDVSDEDVRRMALLMAVYESELKRPVSSLVKGNLMRSLLIQIQKLKVDAGTAMLELNSVMRSQELTLALVAALPALVVVASVTSAFYSVLAPTPPDFKRMAHSARMQAIALERALLLAGKGNVSQEEGEGILLLLTSRLHFKLDKLFTRSGRMSHARRVEWEMIQEDLDHLEDTVCPLATKLATIQRMMRSYAALAV